MGAVDGEVAGDRRPQLASGDPVATDGHAVGADDTRPTVGDRLEHEHDVGGVGCIAIQPLELLAWTGREREILAPQAAQVGLHGERMPRAGVITHPRDFQ